MNGNCEDCPNAGEVPNADRLTCTACQSNEYTDGGICKTCKTGEVPKADRLGCNQCSTSEIAVDGICKLCPNGEIPSSDKKNCTAGIALSLHKW